MKLARGSRGTTLYNDYAALNKARFYRIDLSTDLWGEQIVERHWGRRGTWGQHRRTTFGRSRIGHESNAGNTSGKAG